VELKESPGTKIPDYPAAGIARSLANGKAFATGSIEVSVDISHTFIGDLQVSLVSPQGTAIVLHDGAGGSTRDLAKTYTASTVPKLATLASQPAAGTWQLRSVDRAAQDQGKLNSWRLGIKPKHRWRGEGVPLSCIHRPCRSAADERWKPGDGAAGFLDGEDGSTRSSFLH